jgi:hypothetical protein
MVIAANRVMPATILSAALSGVDAYPVHVEVDTDRQLPSFTVVGLPDSTVRESKERVMAAIRNAGFEWPRRRVTVNLAPAHLRKEGSAFDLPIAVGILAASSQIRTCRSGRFILVGELSLDGSLRAGCCVWRRRRATAATMASSCPPPMGPRQHWPTDPSFMPCRPSAKPLKSSRGASSGHRLNRAWPHS